MIPNLKQFAAEHGLSREGIARLLIGEPQVRNIRRGLTKLYFPEFVNGEWVTRERWVRKQFSKWNFTHLGIGGQPLWAARAVPNVLTDEGEAYILGIVFDGSDAVDATHYIGLDDSAVAEGNSLTDLTNEPSTGSYARQAVNTDNTDYTLAQDSGDYQVTSKTVEFTPSGATWSNMDNAFLCNVSSGTAGILIAHVALSTARTIADGETLQVSMVIKLSE